MRYLKRIVDLLLFCYLTAIAVFAVPPLLGIQAFAVISGSMAPALAPGSIVYTVPRKFDQIRVGDIITYRQEGSGIYVTHRVAEIHEKEQTLITKGDANQQPDGKEVSGADVAGCVWLHVPYLGYAAMALSGIGEKLLAAGGLLWLLLIKSILTNLLEMRRKEAMIL